MDSEARGRKRVRGEIVPFGKLFAALATLRRRDRVTEFDVEIYEDATADIPLSILSLAVTTWLKTEPWFPTVAELLTACEQARLELRDAMKFEPCEQCVGGWVSVGTRSFGHDTVAKRCHCWRAHQDKVAALTGNMPLALPTPQPWTEEER